MTNDEKGYIVGLLLPGAKYSGCWYDDSIVWEDDRPFPAPREINQRYMEWVMAEAILENNRIAWERHHTALDNGFLHTDGVKYYCTERATDDMVKVLVLFSLDPTEPVYVLTYDNTPTSMSLDDFKILAVAVGRYQYRLRQTLWFELM